MKTLKYFYHMYWSIYHVKFKDVYNMKEYPTLMKYHFEKATYHNTMMRNNCPNWLKDNYW